MQSNKVIVGRDEMDQLITMRMDVDRYEAETIPNLQRQVTQLREALREYGCHKASCGGAQPSRMRCTCGLQAAMEKTDF